MIKIKSLLLCFLIVCSKIVSAQDFTIGVIPDWQKLTFLPPDGLQQMKNITQWYAAHKQELNIVFVASLGDMTQGTYSETSYSADQWWRNTYALNVLRDNGIPFSPCQGNHDPYTAIHKYFPVSDFQNEPYWGGSMNGYIENAWYKFEASGMKFMLLTTQWEKSSTVNSWANSIFKANPDRRAIFVNHGGLSNESDNYYLVDAIVRQNDNIFLATMGHLSGNEYFKVISKNGKTQHVLRTDYQDWEGRQDQALIRYYVFKPNKDSIYAYTYNLRTRTYETRSDCEFSFYYQMDDSPQVSVSGLAVSPASAKIFTGDKQELIQVAVPLNATNRAVTWESSNPSVATVNSHGIVTGINEGIATITAKTLDKGFTASSVVTVEKSVVINVTGITVLWPEINLKAGEKQQLNLSFSPSNATNKSVCWSSSDESVAIVSQSGLVTALAAGKTTITIAALDGSGITATSVVTVTPGNVNFIKSISVIWPELTLNVGGKQKLYLSITPTDATTKSVTWTSGNPAVATVSTDGLVTAVSEGKTTVTVAALDGSGITATSEINVTGITANREIKNTNDNHIVTVYPNPLIHDNLTIKLDGFENLSDFEITISNIQGQEVYRTKSKGKNVIHMIVSGLLKSSVYFISVNSGKSVTKTKLFVQ